MDQTLYGSNRFGASPRKPLRFPDILGDPLVRLMMRADGVDPTALRSELARVAATIPAGLAPSGQACPAC